MRGLTGAPASRPAGAGRADQLDGLAGRAGGPYATAKAALNGYGCELADRLRPRGITANAVAPGFITDTEFFDNGFLGESFDASSAAARSAAATKVGRVGSAAEIAAAVGWLLGADAGFPTGQVISPNGGPSSCGDRLADPRSSVGCSDNGSICPTGERIEHLGGRGAAQAYKRYDVEIAAADALHVAVDHFLS
ncbi:SDR family oxidoreductase [Actinomycetospora aeridis]|uniref:SDR family oxidoreductase n=1 Tax=Actinomycetospora aeridis TaxID=3129231 RepID=A0ABU8NF84_9PSEU